jgi:hypothetical protein
MAGKPAKYPCNTDTKPPPIIIIIKAEETLVVEDPIFLTARVNIQGHKVLQNKPTAIKA